MTERLVAWTMTLALWLVLASAAHAQSSAECGGGCSRQPTGEWHANRESVAQSVVVRPSDDGLSIGISIVGQNQGTATSPGSAGGVINENPRGPARLGGPPMSLPPLMPSTGGANVIVRGGPTSFETAIAGPRAGFGGVSIGGWSFVTPGTPGRTTAFAPIGPVPKIDSWNLAQQAEQEFPVPPITLKVNPDPGRVNVDSWFWVEGYDGSMITHAKTQHASHTECRLLNGVADCHSVDDSVTVVVHLSPKHYDWTFGDDRNNTAPFDSRDGLGRAYTDPDPRDASPVAHAYHWSSVNFQSQGGYPISLTITWSAEFSANGGGFQAVPDVSHTFDGRHQVRQIQSIVQH